MSVDTLNLVCLACGWKLIITSETPIPKEAMTRCEHCLQTLWYSEAKLAPFMFTEMELKHLLLAKYLFDKEHKGEIL